MIVLKYNKQNIITNVYGATKLDMIEHIINGALYKVFDNTNAYVGLNIEAINEDGSIKPLSEQVELGLVSVQEDEVLEGDTIRKLTKDEMKEKFPERYPEEQVSFDLKSVRLESHKRLLVELKSEYVDADIDNNLELKEELREQIALLKQDILDLESEIESS